MQDERIEARSFVLNSIVWGVVSVVGVAVFVNLLGYIYFELCCNSGGFVEDVSPIKISPLYSNIFFPIFLDLPTKTTTHTKSPLFIQKPASSLLKSSYIYASSLFLFRRPYRDRLRDAK